MTAWGDRWTAGDAGPPAIVRHTACGHATHVEPHCAHCGEPHARDRRQIEPGPGFVPARRRRRRRRPEASTAGAAVLAARRATSAWPASGRRSSVTAAMAASDGRHPAARHLRGHQGRLRRLARPHRDHARLRRHHRLRQRRVPAAARLAGRRVRRAHDGRGRVLGAPRAPRGDARGARRARASSPTSSRRSRRTAASAGSCSSSISHFELDGEPCLIGHIHDITERRLLEERLRESEERFRQVTETFQQGFLLREVDPPAVLYASPAIARIFGVDLDVIYRDPRALAEPRASRRPRARSPRSATTMTEATDFEYRIVRPDGETRWVRTRAEPVRMQGRPGDADRRRQRGHHGRARAARRAARERAALPPARGVLDRRHRPPLGATGASSTSRRRAPRSTATSPTRWSGATAGSSSIPTTSRP